MAKLTVEAVANESWLEGTNDLVMDLLVSVIDDAGVPVTGLSAANFKVGSPSFGETPVVVSNTYEFSAIALPGSYEVQIETGKEWTAQIYLVVLAVTRTRHSPGPLPLPILDQGQTVLRLAIPLV